MKTLSIAFVAHNKNPALFLADPAFIYRCENLALALQLAGHQVDLLHISQLSARQHYDIVILHRPKKHWLSTIKLAVLRRRGCRVLADFDDLVFMPQWAHVSPGVVNGLVSQAQTQKNFACHAAALKYCDAFVVSVLPLQNKLQQLSSGKPVLCLPNAVHLSWYSQEPAEDRTQIPRLTYFPGTRSHDKDFAIIQPALEQILHEEPCLQLHITGVLNTNIRCRAKQLIQHPKQPFAKYAQHVARSWVNLAPLENTEFNHHKSALKAIEAAWFNAPTLATPIPDMQRLNSAGAILLSTPDDWYNGIKAMLDSQYYQQQSAQLREKSLAAGNAQLHANQFLDFVARI